MRLATIIVCTAIGAAAATPAAAQYCGTFSRCPQSAPLVRSERCMEMIELSSDLYSPEELAATRLRCKTLDQPKTDYLEGLDFTPPRYVPPPNRIDELEQQVEDLTERVEELEDN